MRRYRYKHFKQNKNVIIEAINEHINTNIREYFFVCIAFFVGIIVGVWIINNTSSDAQETIKGYINELCDSIKNQQYSIDLPKLFVKALVSNFRIAFIIWIAGSTIIGIPLVYCSIAYKGVCLGYSISAVIAVFGCTKGLWIAVFGLALQNIIAIPSLFAIAVSSKNTYNSVIKNHDIGEVKKRLYKHTIFSIFMLIFLIAAAIVETFISTNLVVLLLRK